MGYDCALTHWPWVMMTEDRLISAQISVHFHSCIIKVRAHHAYKTQNSGTKVTPSAKLRYWFPTGKWKYLLINSVLRTNFRDHLCSNLIFLSEKFIYFTNIFVKLGRKSHFRPNYELYRHDVALLLSTCRDKPPEHVRYWKIVRTYL